MEHSAATETDILLQEAVETKTELKGVNVGHKHDSMNDDVDC